MEADHLVIPFGNWKRQFLIGVPVIVLLTILFFGIGCQQVWPIYTFAFLFLIIVSFIGETVIDSAHSRVVRRWSLLRFVPLWTKRYALTDFEDISARFTDDQDGNRMWYVHLTKKSGGRLDLKWFGYAKEFPVAAFDLQNRIAETTKLPIKNEFR